MNEEDYPAIYQAADAASLEGQRRYFLAPRLRLGGLIAASLGGAFSWTSGRIDPWGLIAGAALLLALGAELFAAIAKPDRTWYEGRAIAESIKTLTWRYMVGGAPFGLEDNGADDADTRFLDELRGLYKDLRDLEVPPDANAPYQISEAMRTRRRQGFAERKQFYETDRIMDQHRWYSAKATWNLKQSHFYQTVAIAFEVGGIAAAVAKTIRVLPVDLLGVVAEIGRASCRERV